MISVAIETGRYETIEECSGSQVGRWWKSGVYENTLDNRQKRAASVRVHLGSDCGLNGTELQTRVQLVRNGGSQK